MATKTYGTFTKGDYTREAASPAQAVQFRFDGWTEKATKAESKSAEPKKS